MALRLIEIIAPNDSKDQLQELLKGNHVVDFWESELGKDRVLTRILVHAERSEALLDTLEKHLSSSGGFRAMLFAVGATLPRPEEPEETEEKSDEPGSEDANKSPLRLSREELYADVSEGVRISGVYIVTVVLSTLVAAVGLMRGDVTVIIGAMVIAPLLAPNVTLALATTLADSTLALRSLRANFLGLLTALAVSVLMGMLFPADPSIPDIAERTQVGLGNIIIALASGSAAALAFSRGAPAALIGVMVAVALLPPLVVFGLMLAAAHWKLAFGALLLVLTNVICVNLSGVLTFLLQGIRPRTWWDADRAKKATRSAIALWIALLALLAAIIILSTQE